MKVIATGISLVVSDAFEATLLSSQRTIKYCSSRLRHKEGYLLPISLPACLVHRLV
ncbi:MAG: hypothetical protein KAG53_09650 [Endozoicomonadaceae bacterium]|nr:hypothetical protein [Endozoicomonadaceae bacterium]